MAAAAAHYLTYTKRRQSCGASAQHIVWHAEIGEYVVVLMIAAVKKVANLRNDIASDKLP